MTAKTYGTPQIGCRLDQSYRNADSHNAAVIRLAIGLGWQPDRQTLNVIAREEHGALSESRDFPDSELLCECADDAENWLNDQEARPFLYWANSGDTGAFGLWPNVDGAKEDCGFVSRKTISEETDPDDSEYPAPDYRGEWLHVSDHGNATLYVREDRTGIFKTADGPAYIDREIWSVV